MIVACLGDSITAGSPLWDPDPAVRTRIGPARLDERSQWGWWVMQREPSLELRNFGVYGERTDEIAKRLDHAVAGADALIVQGGINDIAQRRSVEDAGRNLAAMIERGRGLGLRVFVSDVLPWPNGDARAATDIVTLNELIHAFDAPLLPFHNTLAQVEHWSDDGDHPSVEGHRLLGNQVSTWLRT